MFLDDLPFLAPLHLVAFWKLLGAFSVAYNIKVLLSGYQSIDMHFIVLPVKFDSRLSISVLRNKHFKKKWRSKSSPFQTVQTFLMLNPDIWRKDRPCKKSHFFGPHFSCEWDERLNFKFDTDSEVLFIYRLIPRKPDFLGWLAIFYTTPVGRFWGEGFSWRS
jgi:hypothetical protein